jgi:serine/threonine-protein kinase
MHESAWKIADFGIAKFVEDSTSLETLRGCLTRAYAAPEQWLLQRPSGATDIYATGCIAHALITGKPPFAGDADALRQQHLNETPQALNALPGNARSIVSQMLRKNAEIRPKLERCIEVFKQTLKNEGKDSRRAAVNMAEAVSQVAITQAEREAEYQARQERKRKRELIFKEAVRDLSRIKGRLFSEIEGHVKDVRAQISSDRISVGNAVLVFDTATDSGPFRGIRMSDPEDMGGDAGWGVHKPRSTWDLIAITSISVEQRVEYKAYKRCANIVFGKPNEQSEHRWYEVAFYSLSEREEQGPPFCLDHPFQIDEVLSTVMGAINLAYRPTPIDGENEDSFIEYWMDIVAKAMVGKLTRPTRLPMER